MTIPESLPVWALIPVKDFARGKSRLDVLDAHERERFARGLFDHVLAAVMECDELAGVAIVTDSDAVAELARKCGAVAIPDTPSASLGGIVDAALDALAARGAYGVVVVMSDLPCVEPDELRAMVRELRGHDVVVAPDLRDEGTNALALRLPGRGPTSFGNARSFAMHCERAAMRGARLSVQRSAGLGFDVDVPSDLEQLRAHPDALAR